MTKNWTMYSLTASLATLLLLSGFAGWEGYVREGPDGAARAMEATLLPAVVVAGNVLALAVLVRDLVGDKLEAYFDAARTEDVADGPTDCQVPAEPQS